MTEFEVLGNRFASGMSVDLTVRARLNGAPPARVPNFVVSCFNFGSITVGVHLLHNIDVNRGLRKDRISLLFRKGVTPNHW